MSSIDIQAVTAPTLLPQPESPRRAASRRASPRAAVYVGRALLVAMALAFAAAIVPVAAIYSFVWFAQI